MIDKKDKMQEEGKADLFYGFGCEINILREMDR